MRKLNSDSVEGNALKGWIEIHAGKDAKTRNIKQFFEEALARYETIAFFTI